GKIFDRSAPPHIIVEAIRVAVKPVMAAIDIDPPFKDMGFAVGHIFPQRQVRVPGRMFHNTHSFSGFGPPVVRQAGRAGRPALLYRLTAYQPPQPIATVSTPGCSAAPRSVTVSPCAVAS